MTQPRQPWGTIAKKVLGKEATEHGGGGSEGQFALVTPCRDQVDFSLWVTREAAEKFKRKLARRGCCGGCWPWTHYIVDVGQSN